MNKTILAFALAALISSTASATVISATEYNYDSFKGHYGSTGLVYTPDGVVSIDGWAQAYKSGSNTVSGYEFGTGYRPTPTSLVRIGYGTIGGNGYVLVNGEYTYWFSEKAGVYTGAGYTFANPGANGVRGQVGMDFSLGSNYYSRIGYSVSRSNKVNTRAIVVVFSKVFE
jgi:hypothetical protein